MRNEYLAKFLSRPRPTALMQLLDAMRVSDLLDPQALLGEETPRQLRHRLTSEYAWAIPGVGALRILEKHGPLIEIGAGTGYWAALLAAKGVDIVCYDKRPPGGSEPNTFRHVKTYHPVEEGGPEKILAHPDRTLFLCWPPYDDNMAHRCAKYYRGKTLLYVGEASDGCNANDAFFRKMTKNFTCERHRIPQWPEIRDYLFVFTRR